MRVLAVTEDMRQRHPYAECVLVAGGHLLDVWMGLDYHIYVARYTDDVLDGVVDMGYIGMDDFHLHPSVALDPTDDCIVLAVAGRASESGPATDHLTKIAKTAHPFGGTAEQWAANDFSAFSVLPYPADTGLVSYAHMRITGQGTLLIVGSGRAAHHNPSTNVSSRAGYLYRYLGDGTPKTAAQMTTGSWQKIIERVPVLAFGSIYVGRIDYRDGRFGVLYHYYEEGSAAGTTRRRGAAYIYTDDADEPTMTWRDASGAPRSVPVANAVSDRVAPLYAMDDYGDYAGSFSLLPDGSPAIAHIRNILAPTTYAYVSRGLSVYTYDDGWGEHVIYPRDNDLLSLVAVRSTLDSEGRFCVFSGRAIDGQVPDSNVIDYRDGSEWGTHLTAGLVRGVEPHVDYTEDGEIALAVRSGYTGYLALTAIPITLTLATDIDPIVADLPASGVTDTGTAGGAIIDDAAVTLLLAADIDPLLYDLVASGVSEPGVAGGALEGEAVYVPVPPYRLTVESADGPALTVEITGDVRISLSGE